jgi:hypothetical protein
MITKFKIFEFIQITENPSFKKWFRNSKVVDENGQPLVLYHGTNADFSEFIYSKFGNNTDAPLSALGFYFTAEHELASKFTKGKNWMKGGKYKKNANLIAVYLSLQNPKYMTAHEWLHMSGRSILSIKELREDLISQGYDGIIIEPLKYDFTGELKTPQYVAFFSNLVKSAIGNNGDFDLNNFNINEEFSDDDNWYTLFVEMDDPSSYNKIINYYKLSKKLNIETHFYEFEEDDIEYVVINVHLTKDIYDDYYNQYGDFSDGGNLKNGGDYEIKDIEYWLKAKKYNIL